MSLEAALPFFAAGRGSITGAEASASEMFVKPFTALRGEEAGFGDDAGFAFGSLVAAAPADFAGFDCFAGFTCAGLASAAGAALREDSLAAEVALEADLESVDEADFLVRGIRGQSYRRTRSGSMIVLQVVDIN